LKKTKYPKLEWHKAVDKVEKITYRVYHGNTAGTAYIISIGSVQVDAFKLTSFVTAWHVIEDLITKEESITFRSSNKKTEFTISKNNYSLTRLGPENYDSALITIRTNESILEEKDLIPMLPFGYMLPKGYEIGWLGYPGIVDPEICFFKGVISGYLYDPPTYLIDGVAINGVSGGPAFDDRAHLIGLVSAYIPNTISDTKTLPGLMALKPINIIDYYFKQIVKASII